jgi:hypothetical protein
VKALLAVLTLAALFANDHGSIPFKDGVNNSHVLRCAGPTSFDFKGKARPVIDKVPRVLYQRHGFHRNSIVFMESNRPSVSRPWFTAKEAAGYIGVTPGTLRSYLKMRKGKPPFFRLAGKATGALRFPKEEFIIWANGGSQKQG